MKKILMVIFLLSLFSCTSTQVKYEKYKDDTFAKEKFLGKWYEIARKNHWFEKDLTKVTAEYSIKANGEIEVKNSGFNDKKQQPETAIGSARLNKNIKNILEVTFFWPFYADYIILDYDKENYSYALIRSNGPDYLWILSRTPDLDENIVKKLLKTAENDGLRTDDLIYLK